MPGHVNPLDEKTTHLSVSVAISTYMILSASVKCISIYPKLPIDTLCIKNHFLLTHNSIKIEQLVHTKATSSTPVAPCTVKPTAASLNIALLLKITFIFAFSHFLSQTHLCRATYSGEMTFKLQYSTLQNTDLSVIIITTLQTKKGYEHSSVDPQLFLIYSIHLHFTL